MLNCSKRSTQALDIAGAVFIDSAHQKNQRRFAKHPKKLAYINMKIKILKYLLDVSPFERAHQAAWCLPGR
jgi:hypothetical protein